MAAMMASILFSTTEKRDKNNKQDSKTLVTEQTDTTQQDFSPVYTMTKDGHLAELIAFCLILFS